MWTLLLLLLPVAAASGWWLARREDEKDEKQTGRGGFEFSSHYFKGLNYLLNEQPDKAIEVFIRMVEVDSETVETHLALGSLFRRRGEVDRAIRIHQNLIARPTLSLQQRSQALLDLGQDYLSAGLLDRAESLFQELIEKNEHVASALRLLVDIYQQEKDWQQAIATAKKLQSSSGEDMRGMVAHYYCELAEQALDSADDKQARHYLDLALDADERCVRASLVRADMARRAGDCEAALRALERVERQDGDFLPEIIEPLRDCYSRLGREAGMVDYLRRLFNEHQNISLMLALADTLRAQYGDAQAEDFITAQLRNRPSVRGLDHLIEIKLSHADTEVRDNLLILKDLTSQLMRSKPLYSCTQCGFTGKALHWQCPSCKRWNTIKPLQGVEGD
ncbi:MAG: lipopolysaccharide assembly protein LapB [Gammaproteobacteria bacterium]|nr:lipopolysaccharide assembly protein LapB [Gammaproteobacteria bacterium]